MTSRSSKNRQITRPNTRRWNKLTAVVLGASVLLNLAPVTSADEPVGVSRPRPAVERWKRLKNQYDVAPTTRVPRTEQPVRSPDHNAADSIRSIPAGDPQEFKTVTTSDAAQTSVKAEAVPIKTAAAPVTEFPDEQETALALPVPPTQEDPTPEGRTPEEPIKRPEEVTTRIKKPDVPAQDNPSYVDDEKVKSPAEFKPSNRGPIRPISPQPQGGPPRKATQVRRIGDIAPLNDVDRDTEIKQYAAEKAREFNVRFGGEPFTPRNFPEVVMPWSAPSTKYYPLYFQDSPLERYGHSYHPLLQPAVSSGRFTAQLILLPYQMAITPPWELESPLGWYRPGDVVPKLHYPFPWSAKAAAVEAATLTGLIFLIQ